MFRWCCTASAFKFRGKDYKRGDVIETEVNLRKHWPGSFTSAEETVPTPRKSRVVSPVTPEKLPSFPPPPPPPAKDRGRDVTDVFPSAGENALQVFKQGGLYFVYDTESPDTPVNSEGTESKVGVGKIIKNFLEK